MCDVAFCKTRPIAEKYGVESVFLFGSYARGQADADSDLDFLVYGGEKFRPALIFSLAEELREAFRKPVDVYEIRELNVGSDFHRAVMRDRVPVA